MRPDQFEREGMVRQVAQQRVELVAAKPGIAQGQAIAFQDVRQQPQAVGAGQAVELLPPGAGQAACRRGGRSRACGPCPGRHQVGEQLGEASAFVVGVGAGLVTAAPS